MAENYFDDRPINPNQQYLEQKQLEHKQKKLHHQYLKKHPENSQVLPCFRQNIKRPKKKKLSPSPSQRKTKAQIYEQIKRTNIEKFGPKNDRKNQKQNQLKNKKIDPLKMTINYKPKAAIIIDTNEYKLKSKPDTLKQQVKQTQEQPKSFKSQESPTKNDQNAKEKYEKLLNIMRKQRLELMKEKQDFEKHKQKLEFKKIIQCQGTIPFIDEIKKELLEKNKLKRSHRIQCKTQKDLSEAQDKRNKAHKGGIYNGQKDKNAHAQKNLSELQSRISKLQQQKQQIEVQVYKNKRNLVDPQNEEDFITKKYSVDQVNQIPAFDIQCIKDFIDSKTLPPHGNQYYQIALKVFETGVDVKQAKQKQRVQNLDRVKQNSQDPINSVDYKRKYQGQTRITKYSNGWIQVWTPGIQRLMANKQLSYKVVWLKNGDIRQEWKDKKFESYFSKAKQVVRFKFDNLEPIYYFTQLNQLEQYNPSKKLKTVMFKEGRIQTFSTEEEPMDGFTI